VKVTGLNLCTFAQPPTAGHECREACWSNGRSCKKCKVECYRRKWSKSMVDADNKKLVSQKCAEKENHDATK
jgi:hypothetical protein